MSQDLLTAAENDNLDEVKRLLASGADPDVFDPETYFRPLHFAATRENESIVKALLAAGANPSARDIGGMSPLFRWYAFSKHTSFAVPRLLIDAGAEVNITERKGDYTLLHRTNWVEFARLLIEAGADVNIQTKDGTTPLHTVETPDMMRLLLETGADVHARTKVGSTPLHGVAGFSRRNNQLGEMARLLIEAGADVTAATDNGTLPLELATRQGHTQVARLLIEAGADVNKVGRSTVPLFSAVLHPDLMEVLLEAGADVNTQAPNGDTPLHSAARTKTERPVQILLDACADPFITNRFGHTPLDGAKHAPIRQLLTRAMDRGE